MPKIVRFDEEGGPEVLKFKEESTREPGKNEVRLKVKAVGLNRAEALFVRGRYLERAKLPNAGVGYEAAGVVTAVGPEVDAKWIGKTVSTVPSFSMTEYSMLGEEVIAPAWSLAEYPEKLSAEEGASLWMQYLTAYGGLMEVAKIRAGDFVVVTAASSSVGLAAIQIAKAEGAVAIATTRQSDKKQELLALGADHVIATEEEPYMPRIRQITGGQGARVTFDSVAGPFVEKLAMASAVHGMIVEYGALSLQPTPFPFAIALNKQLTMRGYTLWEVTKDTEKLDAAKKYVYERLADGRFRPKVAKVFPFAQAADAFRYLESNAQVGKVVISVG